MFFSLIFACGRPALVGPIIDTSQWFFASTSLDFFPEHQPEVIDCPASAVRMELDQLEILTDVCNYALVGFELLVDLPIGQRIDGLVLHSGLFSVEEGGAHFAISIGDELFWTFEESIPSDAEFYYHEAPVAQRHVAGETVTVHLHNHGANDWKIGYLRVPPEK